MTRGWMVSDIKWYHSQWNKSPQSLQMNNVSSERDLGSALIHVMFNVSIKDQFQKTQKRHAYQTSSRQSKRDGYLLNGGIQIPNGLESCWNEQCDQ